MHKRGHTQRAAMGRRKSTFGGARRRPPTAAPEEGATGNHPKVNFAGKEGLLRKDPERTATLLFDTCDPRKMGTVSTVELFAALHDLGQRGLGQPGVRPHHQGRPVARHLRTIGMHFHALVYTEETLPRRLNLDEVQTVLDFCIGFMDLSDLAPKGPAQEKVLQRMRERQTDADTCVRVQEICTRLAKL